MAQQLTVLAILPGDLGLIPLPHMQPHKQWSLTPVPRDLLPSSGLLGTKHKVIHVQTHIFREKIHTHKIRYHQKKKKKVGQALWPTPLNPSQEVDPCKL